MNEIEKKVQSIGVVPVIKLNNPDRDAVPLAKALIDGGVPVAEVTFRAAGAAEAIEAMHDAYPEMLVGAGTVLTTDQVDEAMAAGAQFIVTPGMDPEIVAYCKKVGVQIFPGCTTPTDYHTAYKFGLEVLTVLPRRAVRRHRQDQGYERPVPDVQGYADRRHLAEEPGGLCQKSCHRCLRRLLHGHRRPDRGRQVG